MRLAFFLTAICTLMLISKPALASSSSSDQGAQTPFVSCELTDGRQLIAGPNGLQIGDQIISRTTRKVDISTAAETMTWKRWRQGYLVFKMFCGRGGDMGVVIERAGQIEQINCAKPAFDPCH